MHVTGAYTVGEMEILTVSETLTAAYVLLEDEI